MLSNCIISSEQTATMLFVFELAILILGVAQTKLGEPQRHCQYYVRVEQSSTTQISKHERASQVLPRAIQRVFYVSSNRHLFVVSLFIRKKLRGEDRVWERSVKRSSHIYRRNIYLKQLSIGESYRQTAGLGIITD